MLYAILSPKSEVERLPSDKQKKGQKTMNANKGKATKPTKRTATVKANQPSRHNRQTITFLDVNEDVLNVAIHAGHKITIDFKELTDCEIICTKAGVLYLGTPKQAQAALDKISNGAIKLQRITPKK